MSDLLLRRALMTDGTVADVLLRDGRIAAIGAEAGADVGAERVDLEGHLLVPSFVEPHAHLDKAFLAETVPNPTGDLMGAILSMQEHAGSITVDDTVERASRAVELLLANGTTAIRTHADLVDPAGMRSVEALLAVRERFRGLVDVQVVALSGWPLLGAAGAEHRRLLGEGIAAGVDVIGGCPHLEDAPDQATDLLLDVAATHGLPLDLHTDETLSPSANSLEHLARRIIDTEHPGAVTASHCVSLGVQTEGRQRAIAELVAEAGIGVVALPQTNLFLQGRDHQQAMPRGLTAVRALREAGVTVCAGADNLQDPFNPVGRGDPLETAGLMIITAHLLPDDAYRTVSADARRVLGLPAVGVEIGDPADLVAIPAVSVREAIAFGPGGRHVIVGGRLVRSPSSRP